MKTKRQNTFKVLCIFCLAVATLTGCDKGPENPGETAVLEIDGVSVGASGSRAVNSETGYDGVVKKQLVAGDALTITYKQGGQQCTGRAISGEDASWTTYADTEDATAGTICFSVPLATGDLIVAYEPPTVTSGGITTFGDELKAVYPDGIDVSAGRATITLAHVNSLLSVGIRDVNGVALGFTEVMLMITQNGNDYKIAVDAAGQVIVPAEAELKSIAVTLTGGEEKNVDFAAATLLPGGVHHPVMLTINNDHVITATIGDVIDAWTSNPVQRLPPSGYDFAIATVADLEAFRDAVNAGGDYGGLPIGTATNARTAKVIQLADLDLSVIDSWEPIGKYYQFKGTYDGNGFTISNLRIRGDGVYTAFFAAAENAVLKDIHLREVDIVNTSSMNKRTSASLVAFCKSTSVGQCIIIGCSSTGRIYGADVVGGLCGRSEEGAMILFSRTSCHVSSYTNGCSLGGLVAEIILNSMILGCAASGDVEYTGLAGSPKYMGCFAGLNGGDIYYSYSMGSYRTDSKEDGQRARFCGETYLSNIGYCYTTSEKFSLSNYGTISNCWKPSGDAETGVQTGGEARTTVRAGTQTVTVNDQTVTFTGMEVFSDDPMPYINYDCADRIIL